MNVIDLKQSKSIKFVYLVLPFLLLSVLISSGRLQFFLLALCAILMLGFGVTYRFSKGFINYKFLTLFGVNMTKFKLTIYFPNYNSIYFSSFSSPSEYGPVSAIGSSSVDSKRCIRFFYNEGYSTVFKTKSYISVKKYPMSLSKLLKVELVDKINS